MPEVLLPIEKTEVKYIECYLTFAGLALPSYILLGLPGGLFAPRKFDNNLSSLWPTIHSPAKRGKSYFQCLDTHLQSIENRSKNIKIVENM